METVGGFFDEPQVLLPAFVQRDHHAAAHSELLQQGQRHFGGRGGDEDAVERGDFGQAEVRWFDGAQRHVHATSDATGFLRELLSEGGRVEDLEVRRATLEDAYVGLVRRAEGGTATDVQRNTLAILDAAGEGSLA